MVNTITAKITADATGFNAGLQRATRALDGASQRWTVALAWPPLASTLNEVSKWR